MVKINTRARASQSQTAPPEKTTARKAVPKQTAPAKKTASKAPATKSTARATPARVRKSPAAVVVKDTLSGGARKAGEFASLEERRQSVDPRKRIGGMTYRQISELTGYGLGSEQFITAVEIISGGTTRQEINHRVAALLPPTTRNGTPKTVSNLVSGVIKNLSNRGFTVVGSWKMVAPKE